MANVKISELNEITKSQTAYDDYLAIVDTSADETKKISVENLTANNVYLLAIVKAGEQFPEPVIGAKVYLEGANKIYHSHDGEHWTVEGTPIEGIFYIVLGEKGNYAYDSENETLVSVGGGSGSEIVIGDEEPTEDTKMIIDTDAFNPQYSDITDEYSEANNKAYSCDYINNALDYSTDEVNTHKKWIDGKDIYRKVIQTTKANIESAINALNIDTPIYFYGLVNSNYGFSWEANTYYPDEVGYSNWYHWSQSTPRQIYWTFQNFYQNNAAVLVTLEYTKTTDQGGNN